MKFVIAGLGNYYKELNFLKEVVTEADRLGFYAALMPDHYMWGQREGRTTSSGSLTDYVTLDTWITLSYLASRTQQIHLGTRVTPIPFRPPGMLAKMVSTVDILSNGRTILGAGAGWSQVEFEGYSEWNEPKIRVDKVAEGLKLITKLWTEKEVTFNGKYYTAKGAVLEPKPVQKPYPPILFGSRGDRMLRLAGQYSNICYFIGAKTPQDFEEDKKKVLTSANKFNRADKIAFMAGTESRMPYDKKAYLNSVEEAQKMGASYFQITLPRDTSFISSLRKIASEIMSSF